MKKEFSQNILLTGAGFTKNFGGFLAREMWAKIFNHRKVRDQRRLQDLLLDDFDYESIYHKVIKGNFNDDENAAINEAIFDSYETLENVCFNWSQASCVTSLNKVNDKLIGLFANMSREINCIFTLNQDLFVERYYPLTGKTLIHPGGIRTIPNIRSKLQPIAKSDFVIAPNRSELQERSADQLSSKEFNYIKLHGSFGWLSSSGSNCYVIGKDKENRISDEPLLSWYFDLFNEILSKPNRKLFVIGYGFRDSHINDVIAKAISGSGLRLFVVEPSDPSVFFEELKKKHQGEILRKGLSGYFPYALQDIFPRNGGDSLAWREIHDGFFSR